jgi:coupling of ubiquitin conjugation to ER degradation protein 1
VTFVISANIPIMATTSADEEATISLPSLAFVAVIGFIIYRYFSSSSRSTTTSSGRVAGQRFTAAQVEQITAMFPQLNRRDIMWDLQRNGGSVAATTERILGGGGLSPVCSHSSNPIYTMLTYR